jgi:hypothetical protein
VAELQHRRAARESAVRQEESGISPAGGATIEGGASALLLRLTSVPRSGALGSSRAPRRPSGAGILPAHAEPERFCGRGAGRSGARATVCLPNVSLQSTFSCSCGGARCGLWADRGAAHVLERS